MWIAHPSCKDMVSKAWEWQSSGSTAAKLLRPYHLLLRPHLAHSIHTHFLTYAFKTLF